MYFDYCKFIVCQVILFLAQNILFLFVTMSWSLLGVHRNGCLMHVESVDDTERDELHIHIRLIVSTSLCWSVTFDGFQGVDKYVELQ